MNGIIEIDLHGKNTYQAKVTIDAALRRSKGVYRIRIVHGFNRGTELRDFVRTEYKSAPGVLRLDTSESGATTLVLREY